MNVLNSEPQRIGEILPEVMRDIEARCNRYRKEHGLPLLEEEKHSRQSSDNESEARFEADIAEMDAELLSIQRDAMQQSSHLPSGARSQDNANRSHQSGVWSALRDFHAKPKRARK